VTGPVKVPPERAIGIAARRPPGANRPIIALAALAAALASCSGFPGIFEAERRGSLEVWNRTEASLQIVRNDASFEVPACGHESREDFVLNNFEIQDDEGRFIAEFNGGGPRPVFLVFRTDIEVMSYAVSSPPADPLPPCEGVLHGQEGTGIRAAS
jgi:hypothetical protein